jgi:hypothetical protein
MKLHDVSDRVWYDTKYGILFEIDHNVEDSVWYLVRDSMRNPVWDSAQFSNQLSERIHDEIERCKP